MRAKGIFKRLNVCISLCLVMLLHVGVVTAQNTSPLCFTARNGSVTVRFDIKNIDHTIKYSTNGSTWNTYTSNTNVTIGANQSIYFRAKSDNIVEYAFGNGNGYDYSSRFYFTSSNGGTIEGSGNIMSLYGPSCTNLSIRNYAFAYLFYGCTLLKTAPTLPVSTLTVGCYYCMFEGCTSLITTPALPAKTMKKHCYSYMFKGCISLTNVPSLPATTLNDYCYSHMFDGCSSIVINTTSPGQTWTIPATTTAEGALNEMFSGTGGTMNGTPNVGTTYYIPARCTIFATSNNTTMGYVTGGGTYIEGRTATLTAIGNTHYHFARWSDGNTSNPRNVTVNGDATYTAFFEGDWHTITTNGQNGTVTGGGQHNYGTTATLTATANQHYHFARWSDGNTSNPRKITVVSDSTFTAFFEPNRYYVSSNVNLISGTGKYDYGSTVTLTAHSEEHGIFVKWEDGTTDSVHSFILSSGDTTVIAIYDLDSFNIVATCEHGKVTGNGTYHYLDIVTLYIETDNGYKFVQWSDGNEYNPRVFVVDSDLEVEAICEVVAGVEDVEESVAFYYVDGRVVNPEGVMLRVYSTEGKMVKSGDGDIETEGLPAGMYMVVDERGNSIKIVIMHNKI